MWTPNQLLLGFSTLIPPPDVRTDADGDVAVDGVDAAAELGGTRPMAPFTVPTPSRRGRCGR